MHVLIGTCVSSLARCPFRSLVPFLNQLFLLLSFKSSSHVLDHSPLSDMSLVDVFSQAASCLLALLTMSIAEQKF